MKNVKPKASNHIPEELMEMILSKLPVKSLKRFLTISKDWFNSITTPQFVSKHLKFTSSLQDQPLFLVVFYDFYGRSHVLYSDDDNTYNEYAILRAPEGFSTSDFRVYGCSNGLICLSHCHQLFFWNPSVQRFLLLPDSHIDLRTRIRLPFGFVYDHISNDFKVLRTNCFSEVEVFRLSTNLWEVLTKEIPFYGMYGSQVHLKGFVHWMGDEDYRRKPKIISFDVHKEVFAFIETPALEDPMDFCLDFPLCLHLFQESLVLIHYYDEVDDRIMHSRARYNFWKMEEYGNAESWNLWHTLYCYTIRTPLGFRKNGQFLWVDEDRKKFISTDLENFSETCLGRYESGCVNKCFNYVESLALFDNTTTNRWDGLVDIREEPQSPSDSFCWFEY